MPRLLLILVALGLGLGLVYLIFVKELPRTEEQAASIAQQTVDMTGVVMRQVRGETVEWVVHSDHAIYNETLKTAELRPVRFELFQSGGKTPQPVDIKGTADTAFIDQGAEKVTLKGASHIVKDGSLELFSDQLEYTHGIGFIKATGNVKVHDDETLLQADAAEYTMGTEKLSLTAPKYFQ